MDNMIADTLRHFILERAHVRGEWVHLDTSWQEMLARADYPPAVRKVLGEALTAAALLSATIKHNGALILQIRGDGPIHLLVVHATPQGTVRGLAQWGKSTDGASTLPDLFGNGHIAITLEGQSANERYQGIIPLEGNSLSEALEGYFARSEQLPTRLWLTADQHSAAGILLQRLPHDSSEEPEADHWQRASILLDTLTADELLQVAPETLLYRLFHEEEPRLFTPKPIHFQCSCSREKVDNMLRSLGLAEAESIIAEQGEIGITCEFCNTRYTLDAIDVGLLFKPAMPANDTLH